MSKTFTIEYESEAGKIIACTAPMLGLARRIASYLSTLVDAPVHVLDAARAGHEVYINGSRDHVLGVVEA